METPTTYLAPGQRYSRTGYAWSADDTVTILRVGPDAVGLMWVIYGASDGEECARPAARLEAAIATGELTPVAAGGSIGRC
jgi:hypothetical protein